jgi:hypothetical protein
MIKAKPVIPDRYWILRDQDRKIGNITVTDQGYAVRIGDHVDTFKNLRSLKQKVSVDFEKLKISPQRGPGREVHGYPTSETAYNATFDVQQQLPLWTRERDSRSWYAAGYYQINQNGRWKTVFCPKLILLKRYQYQGPFRDEPAHSPIC